MDSKNGTSGGVGSSALFGASASAWECFSDSAYYDMWAVRPVGERRWGHCFHLPSQDEAEGLTALLNHLSPPGRSGTPDVQQETGSVGTGGESALPNVGSEPRAGSAVTPKQ